MNKKKILIVCRVFYPDISPRAFRATELAKEFAIQGHEVVVVTPKKLEHIAFEKEHNVQIKDLGKLRWKTPNFGSSKIGYILTRMAMRFLQLSLEYPAIELMFKVKKALAMERGYDMLISIAVPYPIHWGVALTWNKKQTIAKTWVADCGDPYMMCETDSFRKWFYFKYIEKWFSKKATYITIPKIEMIENYYKDFHHKIIAIPQGFSFEDKSSVKTLPENNVPTFAFAGSFIPKIRDPRPLLNYLSSLDKDFRFIIYSSTLSLVEQYKNKLGDKLVLSGYIPRAELLIKLSEMDFLINIGYDPVHQVPSKLIDYSIAGRPVFNISDDFNETHLLEFLDGNYKNAIILPDLDQYHIENVCHKFLSLADEQK